MDRRKPRTLADRLRERERARQEREFAAFLEVLYRALMMLARWIERQRNEG